MLKTKNIRLFRVVLWIHLYPLILYLWRRFHTTVISEGNQIENVDEHRQKDVYILNQEKSLKEKTAHLVSKKPGEEIFQKRLIRHITHDGTTSSPPPPPSTKK